MIQAIGRDLITGSNSNGHQFICPGEFSIIIKQIPPDAPTDWEMGPKMKPSEWGAFRRHEWYPNHHGPYAFAVGATEELALLTARNHFAGGLEIQNG